jgi:threonine aldolase
MRQAGIVAAAGIYALDHNVERLAEDHLRARHLAEAWAGAGLAVVLDGAETNFVQVDVSGLGLSTDGAIELAAAAGVQVSGTVRPGLLRAVTHLDVSDEDIQVAAERFPRALRTP